MASPQLEHGYTRIANELMSALMCFDFKKLELVTLLCVIRETYGRQAKGATLTPALLAEATGVERNNVRKALLSLSAANVITLSDGEVGIQKDYETWLVPARCEVKTTALDPKGVRLNQPRIAVKTTAELRLNQPRIAVKTTADTPLEVNDIAAFQEAKERKKEKKERNPLTPTGGTVPFSEPLEPLKPDEEPELQLTTPARLKPATPAPKPSKRKLIGDDDPRFAEFRALYTTSGGPRCKEWDKALAYWVRNDLGSDERFPLVMAALREDLASSDWQRADHRDSPPTPHGFVPMPASWLGKNRWKDVTLALVPITVQATPQTTDDRLYALVTKGYQPGNHSEYSWLMRTLRTTTAETGAQFDTAALEAQLKTEGFRATMIAVAAAGNAAFLARQRPANG